MYINIASGQVIEDKKKRTTMFPGKKSMYLRNIRTSKVQEYYLFDKYKMNFLCKVNYVCRLFFFGGGIKYMFGVFACPISSQLPSESSSFSLLSLSFVKWVLKEHTINVFKYLNKMCILQNSCRVTIKLTGFIIMGEKC